MPSPPASMPPIFDPRARDSYKTWVAIPIRFGDQDSMGHVNNAVISTYFEQARCTHVSPLIVSPDCPTLNIVLARIVIDYVKEIRFPGVIDVGIRIARIGDRSCTIASAVFSDATCCAVSEATIVFFDTASRRSATPPDAVRALLRDLL